MDPFVVSDVSSWTAFFDKLLEVHAKLRGSAFNKEFKKQTWGLKLINTATTRKKGGGGFPYFQAVDTGRGPVTTRFRGFIAFAGKNDEKVFRHTIHGTLGENITGQATAKMNATFDLELRNVMNIWLKNHSEDEVLRLKRVRPQQAFRAGKTHERGPKVHSPSEDEIARVKQEGLNIVLDNLSDEEREENRQWELTLQSIGASETEIAEEEEDISARRQTRIAEIGKRAYTEVFEKLSKLSKLIIDEREIVRQALVAKRAAEVAETNRAARKRSELASKSAFRTLVGPVTIDKKYTALTKKEEQAILNNSAIKALVKLPNWWMLSAIFAKVTGDQIEGIWKPLTPSREDTLNFKLIYADGGLKASPPADGGQLRAGYKLVTNEGLRKFIFTNATLEK